MRWKVNVLYKYGVYLFFSLFLLETGSSAVRINKYDLETPSDDYIHLLQKRKSTRNFTAAPLTTQQLSYLLYAANALMPNGSRTAPSARAVYPIDIYVFIQNVTGFEKGIYFYNPRYHYLQKVKTGDFVSVLAAACNHQPAVSKAAVVISLIYVASRFRQRYGERGVHFAALEAGHISQNFLLAAAKLNLGALPVGGFDNGKILSILGLSSQKKAALYLNLAGNIQ
jgi:SagB-type dehydrogenase family enzyme